MPARRSPRVGRLSRRSPLEWGGRLSLALVAAVLGYVSVTQTLSAMVRNQAPDSAWRLAPGDGRSTAAYARSLALKNATAGERALSDTLGRQALREDATAVAAMTALAINAEVRGNVAGARRLMRYAHSLSRRDLQVELWLIEDGVGRGNIPEALRHYDIALRTSGPAADLLYPVLAQAIAEPLVRRELVRTLSTRPAWADSFTDYASTMGPNPQATAMLLHDLNRSGVHVSDGAGAATINGLIARGHVDEAWALYASLNRKARRDNIRNGRFSDQVLAPSTFDWTIVDQPGVVADLQFDRKGGLFDFSLPANTGGVILKQAQLLPAGRYKLAGHGVGLEYTRDAQPYWQLTCANGLVIGSVDIPPTQAGVFSGDIVVPDGCSQQTLTFVARPSTRIEGVSGRIDRVEFIQVHHA